VATIYTIDDIDNISYDDDDNDDAHDDDDELHLP
jgi:hypothetical protein